MKPFEERFFELTIRSQILKDMKKKMDEELNNKGMQILAKMMDESFDARILATRKVLDNWDKEIDNDLEQLHERFFNEFMDGMYAEMVNKVKNEDLK